MEEILIEELELDPDLAMEIFDYTEIAMASLLETQHLYNKLELEQMIQESLWIQQCLESGFILPMPVMEEGDQQAEQGKQAESDAKQKVLKARSEGSARDLANAIKAWLDEIIANIRRGAVKRKQKYAPWLEDVSEELKTAAGKMTYGVKITPYHRAKYDKDVGIAVNSINDATRSLENKDLNNFDFCQAIVEPEKVANRSGDLANLIKNYFRYNIKNTNKVDTAMLAGQDLIKFVPDAITYITKYDEIVGKNVQKISNAYNPSKIAKAIEKAEEGTGNGGGNATPAGDKQNEGGGNTNAQPDTASVNPHLYLSVEDRAVCESLLTTLINYIPVTENGEDKPTPEQKQSMDAGKTNQTSNGQASQGTTVTTADAKTGKDIDPKEEQNKQNDQKDGQNGENQEEKQEDKGPSKAQVTAYMKSIEYYIKLLISSYATACDERFITYLNVLFKVADAGKVPKPKFDIKGNYTGTKGGDNKVTTNNNSNNNQNNTNAEATDNKDKGNQETNQQDNENSENTKQKKTFREKAGEFAEKAGETVGNIANGFKKGKDTSNSKYKNNEGEKKKEQAKQNAKKNARRKLNN